MSVSARGSHPFAGERRQTTHSCTPPARPGSAGAAMDQVGSTGSEDTAADTAPPERVVPPGAGCGRTTGWPRRPPEGATAPRQHGGPVLDPRPRDFFLGSSASISGTGRRAAVTLTWQVARTGSARFLLLVAAGRGGVAATTPATMSGFPLGQRGSGSTRSAVTRGPAMRAKRMAGPTAFRARRSAPSWTEASGSCLTLRRCHRLPGRSALRPESERPLPLSRSIPVSGDLSRERTRPARFRCG